jgi:hypothetical protein
MPDTLLSNRLYLSGGLGNLKDSIGGRTNKSHSTGSAIMQATSVATTAHDRVTMRLTRPAWRNSLASRSRGLTNVLYLGSNRILTDSTDRNSNSIKGNLVPYRQNQIRWKEIWMIKRVKLNNMRYLYSYVLIVYKMVTSPPHRCVGQLLNHDPVTSRIYSLSREREANRVQT